MTSKQTTRSGTVSIVLLGLIAAVQGAGPNIASTALVGASRGLSMTAGDQATAASSQTLAIAASVISMGLLADKLGRRRVLVASLMLGAIGNLVVMAAPTTFFFIAGQALTGIGLGAAFAAAFAYIKVLAKPENVAGAMGLFAASSGLFTVVFTFIGGVLASQNWRLAFALLPVMAGIAILGVFMLLPQIAPVSGAKYGVTGQILLAFGLVALLYGVAQLASSLTSLKTWIPIVAGLLLLTGFVISQTKGKNPIFPMSLFAKPLFLAAIAAGFVYNFGNAVAFLQTTNLWQYILSLKTSEVSVWQLPFMAAGIISALLFGRFMSKGMSARAALISGSAMAALGFMLLYFARSGTELIQFLPGTMLIGAGVIVASLPYGTLILSEAPANFYGPVTSSRTAFGQLFYSIGIAVSTVVIDQLTKGGTVNKLVAAGVPASQTGTGLDAVTAYASAGTQPDTSLGKEALASAHSSYIEAFGSMMLIAALVTLVVGVAGYLLLSSAQRSTNKTTEN